MFDPSAAKSRHRRAGKRRKTESEDEDDVFEANALDESDVVEEGNYTFVVPCADR